MTLAIDLSNYTTPFDADGAKQMYDAGVRRAIVQFVAPGFEEYKTQIPALQAAGIEVEGYVFIWFTDGIAAVIQRVRWACEQAKIYRLARMWLDCEQSDAAAGRPAFDYTNAPVSPTIRAAIAEVVAHAMATGLYTAKWWWVPGASNSDEFSKQGIPLWDAHYDEDPDIDDANYGGWITPAVTQFKGWSASVAGIYGIDLDAYVAPVDQSVTQSLVTIPQNLGETVAFFKAVGDNAGKIVNDDGATVELVISGYAEHPDRDTYIVQVPHGAGRGN